MRGGSVSAAAMALAVSVAIWHFASPQWTLNQMRAALEARDAAALASFVDFAALRDSLEADVAAAALGDLRADDASGAREVLVEAAARAPIDRLASPTGLQALFGADGERAWSGLEVERDGFSIFRVTGGPVPATAALVFRRRGAAWKLAAVDQPGPRLPVR